MKIKKPKFSVGDTLKTVNGRVGKVQEVQISIREDVQEIDYFIVMHSCDKCGHNRKELWEEREIEAVTHDVEKPLPVDEDYQRAVEDLKNSRLQLIDAASEFLATNPHFFRRENTAELLADFLTSEIGKFIGLNPKEESDE